MKSLGGEYMQSAVLVEWLVAEGAAVQPGDVVAMVETAKATVEIEAPAAGIVQYAARLGDEIALGAVIAHLASEAVKPGLAQPPPAANAAPAGTLESGLPRRWQQAYASPLAKRIAAARNIDLQRIDGTGPKGRIVRADLSQIALPAGTAVYRMARDLDATSVEAARARRWACNEHVTLGAMVAEVVRSVLSAMTLPWSVVSDQDEVERETFAIFDFTAFGIGEADLPLRSACATLVMTSRGEGKLRLALVSDAASLPCVTGAQLLGRLGSALEHVLM
jgi:pyruvate/2-oxoglutarate dehydrogenase complex dihydrolipoamide acyltransferase (E2) component